MWPCCKNCRKGVYIEEDTEVLLRQKRESRQDEEQELLGLKNEA